jgi:hypothetical protein
MGNDNSTNEMTAAVGRNVPSFENLMLPSALLDLPPCCRETVKSHVAHNPMMVCPDCKIMIKCFSDEKSFNNYLTFCRSRGRRVKTVVDSGFYFAMYNTYPMHFSSGG